MYWVAWVLVSPAQCSGWSSCTKSFNLANQRVLSCVSSQIIALYAKNLCMRAAATELGAQWCQVEQHFFHNGDLFGKKCWMRWHSFWDCWGTSCVWNQVDAAYERIKVTLEMWATQPESLAQPHKNHFLSLSKHEAGVSLCSCMSRCSSDNTAWWLISTINCTLI